MSKAWAHADTPLRSIVPEDPGQLLRFAAAGQYVRLEPRPYGPGWTAALSVQRPQDGRRFYVLGHTYTADPAEALADLARQVRFVLSNSTEDPA
jgi:hypothetical protein